MRQLLCLLLALLFARSQDPGLHAADALYPCRSADKVLHFFELESNAPELAKLNSALGELGAELAYGPRTTSGRPGHAFLAVRAPREANAKKLATAVKKGGGAASELACVAFDGRTGEGHDFGLGGYGVTQRDMVMGIAGDIVWYEAFGTWSEFFGPPGKLEPKKLAERYAKLYAPYGGAQLGEVVHERFAWTLTSAPDDKLRAKVLKLIEKLPGVIGATIDGTALTVTVALQGLELCGDVGTLASVKDMQGEPLDDAGKAAPRAAFDAGALYAALKAESLVP